MSAPLGLLLTPGAGASRESPALVAVEKAVAPLPCRRVDFPYRLAGRKVPDRPEVAVAHLRTEATAFAASHNADVGSLVLGGRSYGGRMCSMAVADGLPAAGLVLLSYPLHPPGRPEKLRTEHFGRIDVPVLFVSGRTDPFGSPAEFDEHVAAIPGLVTQVWVTGAHDVRGREAEVAAAVAAWVAAL
ncbi:dienelactone hydrolase [Beutenbergia cavernae DSM 12333]|uniref:Dienelactone hydrolase n=1 Tax=Beutenbergia cavernae (strain ATCC BAA-8 / DSM 12333 / CCUG 43141 / JCM 11478 / NBRC 16432 / NCIMB 13614 / HKI 0122) TaxID=471853 RepID=C5C4I4_BEUC1|nr:alpha/beta family hydrolase [Beutenbergia cavernae]ACQ82108.1 dienelactone hydrolase [Beutenbergia cavernae DSM 12333]